MLESGLVMDRQLAISSIIQHAELQHGDVEIVARETHGPLFRYTYADCAGRTRRLANALLQTLGSPHPLPSAHEPVPGVEREARRLAEENA